MEPLLDSCLSYMSAIDRLEKSHEGELYSILRRRFVLRNQVFLGFILLLTAGLIFGFLLPKELLSSFRLKGKYEILDGR